MQFGGLEEQGFHSAWDPEVQDAGLYSIMMVIKFCDRVGSHQIILALALLRRGNGVATRIHLTPIVLIRNRAKLSMNQQSHCRNHIRHCYLQHKYLEVAMLLVKSRDIFIYTMFNDVAKVALCLVRIE